MVIREYWTSPFDSTRDWGWGARMLRKLFHKVFTPYPPSPVLQLGQAEAKGYRIKVLLSTLHHVEV